MAISELTEPHQPDIGYTPDLNKYQARVKRRLATENLATTLPPNFPKALESDLVWDNTDVAARYNWTYKLSASNLEELETALQHFKSLQKPLGYINQGTFPLPTLHDKLRDISREIHNGFGFKVVRGLPVDKHTREDILIIYAGLASHIAPIRGRQDSQYQGKAADVVLNHIKDLSSTHDASKIGAPAYTSDKQVFHTDSGDIIALLCLEEAAEGGQSRVSSSWRVYNELAATRPDLIRTLAEEWPTEVFGDPTKKYVNRSLLHYTPSNSSTPERMIIQYARRTFTGFLGLPRSRDIPPISEAQAEALDTLHFLAEKHALGLDFKKGEVQFVNNLSIFHARDGFRNSAEKQRHLVRLWLRDPENAWEIPESLEGRWDKVFKDVKEERQVWPLEPYIRSASLGMGK
ncbi:Clavaminate synthase-like protein [Ophiobolus disseminans]|uniref:Clavaminate synthase-like protein n=1 Tax=Ophiobolus disseminans TaxID=1469910 RepID=A0A6A7AI16_9PLEO|nr:Clavaminate synthase-like protein [Ophiobolus disseminans]